MSDVQARREILDALAAAASEVSFAIASLGEAYEHLDDNTADRLEDGLFRPAQAALGVAQRAHNAFAERHRLPGVTFEARTAPAATQGPRPAIAAAVEALGAADATLAELQDSMKPVEYGDPELRNGIAEVRRHLNDGIRHARDITRTLGR